MLPQNNSDDYQKVKDVFIAALDVAPEKRRAFLDGYGADEKLLGEVESLLKAREEAGEFLNHVSAADTVFKFADQNGKYTGRKIGSYVIEKEIGRGGMGVVFLAGREDFKQKAAIKLIKRGMDSDAILERFTREREILAALNHPYIARLTDGGTTEEDTPFFVMEYVEGIPIDEFCKNKRLSSKETLELFGKVCEAVAFAHQKLVVHRDLKPSNILVTEDGTPKLLDFGIAKLLNSTDANDTQTNLRVLTPAYASPEQIQGETVDTTSDVYSLGKILSELLQVSDCSSGIGAINGNVQPKINSAQSLPVDLQAVLQTALRPERVRRYNSVEKFAEDLRRFQIGLPVTARKDTFSYRTAKFIQRKRYAVAFGLLFVLTLIGGLLATLWQAREARRERAVAERRFDNLRNISGSFITEIHTAIQNLPGSLPARQMLLRHAVEQLDALAAESGDNPALQEQLAEAYFNSAQLPDMLLAEKDSTLKKEIAVYRKLLAADPQNIQYQEKIALANLALGDITKVRGSIADALELDRDALSTLERIAAKQPDDTDRRVNLASAYQEISLLYILEADAGNASEMSRKELAAIEEIRLKKPDEPALKQLFDIARIRVCTEQTMNGDFQTAISTLRQVLSEYETARAKSPNDTSVLYYLWVINRRLAVTLEKSGDLRSASEHYRTALTLIENLAGESPNDYGYYRNSALTNIYYGRMLVSQKHPADAIKLFRRALELSAKVLENDADNAESKSDAAWANANLGDALFKLGKTEDALNYLNKSLNSFNDLAARDEKNAETQANYSQTRDWLQQISNSKKQSSNRY